MQKENNESLIEDVTIVTHYQWIKGDTSGDVVTIKDTDDKWINFNEPSKIDTNIFNGSDKTILDQVSQLQLPLTAKYT